MRREETQHSFFFFSALLNDGPTTLAMIFLGLLAWQNGKKKKILWYKRQTRDRNRDLTTQNAFKSKQLPRIWVLLLLGMGLALFYMESRKTVHLRPLIAMSTLAKLRPLFKIRKQQTCFLWAAELWYGSKGSKAKGFFSVPIQVLAETNKIWKDVKQQNSITICCASIFFASKLARKCLFVSSWEYWISRESSERTSSPLS